MTARAVIRDRALVLFAEHGPDAVTIRQIATAAGVSPALVVHHYGSKQGLRDAVDEHVAGLFDALLTSIAEHPAPLAEDGPLAASSFAELMRIHLPEGSALPAYLRRLLLSGDRAGRELFRRVFDMTAAMTDQLVAAGIMRRTADPAVRSAFVLINDLAVVLLRDHLADVLGVDPLSEDGMRRWATGTLAAYVEGVFYGEER